MARGDHYAALKAANDELHAERDRLRVALERCVQALETCDGVGEPHPTHDAVIAGLAKVCGSGEMMRAIVREWRVHLVEAQACSTASANYFTVGPTRYAVQNALAVGRAALGARDNDQRDSAGAGPEAGDDRQGGYAPAGTGC